MVTQTVKLGYKQTEIGVIPENWNAKMIDDLAKVKSGKRLPLGKSLVNKETKHPYIRILDMFPGGVSLKDIRFVPENVFPSIKNYRIFKEDIFISVAGSLGIVGKIPINLDGANLTENADRLTNIKCNRDFLLWVFLSPIIQKRIESERTLGAQPKLALTRIRKFLVPLPDSDSEQSAIAQVLSDTDTLIKFLENLIEKKKNIKQGAMRELLTGKKRLVGFNGKWQKVKLENIATFHKGKGLSKSEITDEGICECIHYGELFTKYSEKITKIYSFTKKKQGQFHSKNNDVLMPTSDVTPNGLATASCISEDEVILGGDILILRTSPLILNGIFLAYGITLNKSKIMQLVTGSTVYHLHGSNMAQYEFNSPPTTEEQSAIAKILTSLDEEIDVLEGKRDKYQSIKQGMMQELLTGRIRLK